MTFWAQAIRIGLSKGDPGRHERIILSNTIGLLISLLSIVLLISYTLTFQWDQVSNGTLLLSVAGLAALLLNAVGLHRLCRLYLAVLVPAITLLFSIITKLHDPAVQDSEYYEFRYIILASGVLPFALFRLRERMMFAGTVTLNLFLLLAFDPIHNLFGVGYYQTGQEDVTYYFVNVVTFITYLVIALSLLIVKRQNEASEERNRQLIVELHEAKEGLEERNTEIEAQNHEILRQSEVLSENQNRLTEAYSTIERQNQLLEREKVGLEGELVAKNAELLATNSELIRYNNELRQFSFTVSHNLRGPVATLLGLAGLVETSSFDEEQNTIFKHIHATTKTLDGIIHDLNKIIDIRYDIFKVMQRVSLADEVNNIRRLLEHRSLGQNISISCEFSVDIIFSVKPMVHSILYNLISNSIKYRASVRPLEIQLKAHATGDHYCLEVTDNGLGIDLERNRQDLFKLYRRFHHQSDGTGVGLYLVKLQCETLGGYVEVSSELNRYTTFRCWLRKPANIARQVLYDEPHACIFYDATVNATGVIWHCSITSAQYRSVFNKCADFMKVYRTPNWISDITHQGPVDIKDQEWMFEQIIPLAKAYDVRRIALVKPIDVGPSSAEYIKRTRQVLSVYGLNQNNFSTIEEAEHWLLQENELIKQAINDGPVANP
jgi:signal transduction histidine kinase